MFRFLNTVLGGDEVFDRHSSLDSVVGEPDFILRDPNQALRLVIEVKTKWVLSVDDLVTTYAQNLSDLLDNLTTPTSVYSPLRQIFGYLSHNHLQFGALTTYDKTWFLYRPFGDPGQLRISPAIRCDDRQPTLFQCLFYLTSLARDSDGCATAPPSSPLPPPPNSPSPDSDGDSSYDDKPKRKRNRPAGKRGAGGRAKGSRGHRPPAAGGGSRVTSRSGHSSNGGEGDVPMEFFDWGSFKILDVLGRGRTGTVFKAILHGEVIALKTCDLWQHPDYEKEVLNEVQVYHALEDLQGYCIPRFKGAGYTAGGLFVIATDIVGSPLEDAESLSDQERLVIQTALSSIHRHGFVHHDVRLDNILIRRSGRQFHASLIDFAFSKQGFQRDFLKEMGLLEALLGQSQVGGLIFSSCFQDLTYKMSQVFERNIRPRLQV